MIELFVKEYCHNCPHFEPEAESTMYYDNKPLNTVVSCMHMDKCIAIEDYVREQILKESQEKQNDG